MVSINLSTTEQYSSDSIISASGPPLDPSTYESPASMTALSPSDVITTDVESGDDEEISNKEMAHSYKIMYEKLVETMNENKRLLKQISQLCRKKNEFVKQVNVFKNEKEGYLNELEQIKVTMWMMIYGTTTLDQILLMGRTTKDHKGLDFMKERSKTKPHTLTNFV